MKNIPLLPFMVIYISVVSCSDSERPRPENIRELAKKYVVIKQLRKNMLNGQLINAVRMRKPHHFFINLIHNLKADINALDEQGRTALMHAVIIKDYQTAQILLELNADINLQDTFGKTALTYAYENADTKMIHIIETAKKYRNLQVA